MNITELIVDFIKQGNVVELPGIGTLTGSMVNAYHDAATGTYYPARRTVVLNKQESGNKAVVRCISERECVTVETAEQIWNNYLAALDDKLRNNPQGHEFPGLGVLSKTASGASFEAVPGLDLDAAKRHAQPLENVSTYTPKDTADPFAIFDQPVVIPASQGDGPEAHPETPALQEKVEPVVSETPAEGTPREEEHSEAIASDDEALRVKEAEKAAKEAEKAAKEAEKAAKAEEARLEKEAEKAAKEAEKAAKEAEKAAKAEEKNRQKEAERAAALERKEAEARRKAAEKETRKALREEKKAERKEKKANKEEERKASGKEHGKHFVLRIIVLVLLLLALVAGGVYYVMTRFYVPETQGANDAEHVEVTPYNSLSRSIDGLQFEEQEIQRNKAMVTRYLGDYIRQYLQARRYSNAYAVVMDRVGEYADLRLHELMSDNRFALIHLLPMDDYYRDFCYDDLKEQGGYVYRCRVQKEIMDESRLDAFLDELIAELGLHPDGTVRAVAAPVAQKKEGEPYVETVPSAPTFKSSKQGYDIIAGFCTQKLKADKMANHLKSLGCDAYVINRSGLYYVSMGSAPTRTAAEALYNHIKEWYQGDITIKNFNE